MDIQKSLVEIVSGNVPAMVGARLQLPPGTDENNIPMNEFTKQTDAAWSRLTTYLESHGIPHERFMGTNYARAILTGNQFEHLTGQEELVSKIFFDYMGIDTPIKKN